MHPFIETQKEWMKQVPAFRAGDTLRVSVRVREGDKERHPFERMTEPRRREEDLGSENRAHQDHAVGGAAQGAEHCSKDRRLGEPEAIRGPDHCTDHDTPAECAEEEIIEAEAA